MHFKRPFPLSVLALAILGSLVLSGAMCNPRDFTGYDVLIVIEAGPNAAALTRETFVSAKPGTIIEFGAGTFLMDQQLDLTTSHVLIRGQGMHATILDFSPQRDGGSGGQGILASGSDELTIQNLTIRNTAGDAIKVEGADGVVFQNVKTEWTGPPSSDNGAYGFYPVGSNNVLIEGCVVRGASDAGIYVGQSNDIIVRGNVAELNVAGIEIENSTNADVYLNYARNNVGGILIFDLPGLSQAGSGTRVFQNHIIENNYPVNFGSGTVGLVPPGTGVIILATDNVEVFDNLIRDNMTVNLTIVSYYVTQPTGSLPESYDAYAEGIHIHDNILIGGGTNPQGPLGAAAAIDPAPEFVPDIVWGGWLDENKLDASEQLPPELKICIHDNTDDVGTPSTYANMQCLFSCRRFHDGPRDRSRHDCTHPPLPQATLAAHIPVPSPGPVFTPEQIEMFCNDGETGVNWDAFVVNCPDFADYRLFEGNDPLGTPQGSGVSYSLTMPLFSDYANKYRVMFIPPGKQATYRDDAVFDFPVGTIIAKSFAFQAALDGPEELIETRLLIHREEGWASVPYIWSDTGVGELKVGGGTAAVTVHTGRDVRDTNYQIPNVNQCTGCHGVADGSGGDRPIGPKARLLNRPEPLGSGENQLDQWTRLGLLAGAPRSDLAPKLPSWDDPREDAAGATLDELARGYIESNCAHCHNPDGRARFSGMFLEADRALGLEFGICKTPVAAGGGAGGLDYGIVPGHPELSIFSFRTASTQPGEQMPELSKSLAHTQAVELIDAWITSLPAASCTP